ncbi:MAG: metalloregulator ArsR/SmtB family transcription factor [Nitrospiraceae bacterium]|nr:metalloregulator ArsR/SmtB family transcription factor [Nitrospiraceae bacterium]
MNEYLRIFKALSDSTRLRILLLVSRKELCVCQIMAVLGISQPLVSKDLNVLKGAGLLSSRREGKLMFYKFRPAGVRTAGFLKNVFREMQKDPGVIEDMQNMVRCEEFQKLTGRCDMESFMQFMEKRRKK